MRSNHCLHRVILDREEVTAWDAYPFSVPAIRELNELELHPKVTFFVGENGSGKSTLLEAIAEKLGFQSMGGGRNASAGQFGYESALTRPLRLSRTQNRPLDGFFLRAESFYNFATGLDELEQQLRDIVASGDGAEVGLDQIIIELWRRHKVHKPRTYIMNKLYRMGQKASINSVEGKKGLYCVPKIYKPFSSNTGGFADDLDDDIPF